MKGAFFLFAFMCAMLCGAAAIHIPIAVSDSHDTNNSAQSVHQNCTDNVWGGLTATPSPTYALVEWGAPAAPVSVYRYRLQVQLVGSPNWNYYYPSSPAFVIPELTPNTNYRVIVRYQQSFLGAYSTPIGPVNFTTPTL